MHEKKAMVRLVNFFNNQFDVEEIQSSTVMQKSNTTDDMDVEKYLQKLDMKKDKLGSTMNSF